MMPPPPSSSIYRSPSASIMIPALHRIRAIALAGSDRYAAFASTDRHVPSPSLASVDLMLPVPGPITTQLLSSGLDDNSAQRVAEVYLRVSLQLKASCEDDFRRRRNELRASTADARLASLIPLAYTTIYSRTLTEWESYILRNFLPRLLAQRSKDSNDRPPPSNGARVPFNQYAVPWLEAFFEKNAFPSRLEKLELASQCKMQYRQIHVWFQNRRSRLRKEGRVLKRQEHRTVLAEELENVVVQAILPCEVEEDIQSADDVRHPDAEPHSCVDPHALYLNCPTRPQHAFPAPYPPLCPYDPFPTTRIQGSFELPWPRRDTNSTAVKTPTIAVSELASALSNLTLQEDLPSTECLIGSPEYRPDQLASESTPPIGFITPFCRAPHPALARRIKHAPRASRTPNPAIRGTRVSTQRIYTNEPTHAPSRQSKRTLPRRVPRTLPGCQKPTINPCPVTFVNSRSTSLASSSSLSSTSDSEIDSPLSTPPSTNTPLPTTTDICADGHFQFWQAHSPFHSSPSNPSMHHVDPFDSIWASLDQKLTSVIADNTCPDILHYTPSA